MIEKNMDTLKADVNRLMKATFGDPDNPRDVPGIIHDLRHLDSRQKRTNEILDEMKTDVKKVVWLILIAVIGAALKLVIGG